MMRWPRPYILNSVCVCSMFISFTMESYIKSMKSIKKYFVTTAERLILLKPNVVWDGGRNYQFEVTGMRNSNYAKDYSKEIVSSWSTFLNGVATSFRIKLMPIIVL